MAQVEDDKNEDVEVDDGYKVAQRVSVHELMNKDQNDPSLQKYKQNLLGDPKDIIIDANDNRTVFMDKFILLVEGEEPLELDTSKMQDDKHPSEAFKLVEGCKYQLKIVFRVQKDIVLGFKKKDIIKKGLIKVVKESDAPEMIGSFKPNNKEVHEFTFPEQTAPTGFIARGKYVATTKFVDDDKKEHLILHYSFEIIKPPKEQ